MMFVVASFERTLPRNPSESAFLSLPTESALLSLPTESSFLAGQDNYLTRFRPGDSHKRRESFLPREMKPDWTMC
jgi:hypothetical protein